MRMPLARAGLRVTLGADAGVTGDGADLESPDGWSASANLTRRADATAPTGLGVASASTTFSGAGGATGVVGGAGSGAGASRSCVGSVAPPIGGSCGCRGSNHTTRE